jgi:phospholipid-binding lipoprotein MlaA
VRFSLFQDIKSKSKHFAFLLLLVLSGCSTTSSVNQNSIQDPLEPLNRSFWTLTWEYTDKYVSRPVSLAYVENVPTPLRAGLSNMALNLNEPSAIINNLLQLKFKDAAASTGRFALNSTIGLLGFFDPASDFGWTRSHEEFGEVLGTYGVSDGPFLIIPALGPSSVREEVGDYIDHYYWPIGVLEFWPNLLRSTILGMEARAKLVEQEKLINDSIDSYEFIKNAYYQNMQYKVHDGNPPIEINEEEEADLEAFLDEMDE